MGKPATKKLQKTDHKVSRSIEPIENSLLDLELDQYTFNGNPNLKPAGAQIPIPTECIEEYVRCAEDIEYFCEHYVKIISLDEGVAPFVPYKFQKKILSTLQKERFVIIKAPRQCGKTTTSAAFLLWSVLFQPNYRIGILANKLEQAAEILDRVKMAYANIPKWMQQGIIKWNDRSIILENGSKILCSATSGDAIRGQTLNAVYLDEFAHIDGNLQQKFFTSIYPVITSGTNTKIIITSTPNGFEWFAKLWMDACKKDDEPGKNTYVPISVHWSDVPGRDEAWKKTTIDNTSAEQFRQEFECEFIGSSDTLISPDTLSCLTYMQPLRSSQNVKIFEEPVKGHMYFIAADVARGGGGDYSAFAVVDVTTFPYRVVATFRDNSIAPSIYPNYIHHAAQIYNGAAILVETNDVGGQVADILNYELENEGLLSVTMNAKKGQSLGGGFGKGGRFGVKTTVPVKRIGCFALKGLLENKQIILNDPMIVDELFTFVATGPSYAASPGKHDDMVMCLVLFAWASTQKYFVDLLNSDARRRLVEENELMIEEDLVPFGFIDSAYQSTIDGETGLQTYSGMYGEDTSW